MLYLLFIMDDLLNIITIKYWWSACINLQHLDQFLGIVKISIYFQWARNKINLTWMTIFKYL